MMTNQKTVLILTFLITLFNNCSSLFYTNSRENDFPRFGKRFFGITNPPETGSKEWYHTSSIRDDYSRWKPGPSMNLNAYAWRPILTSIESLDGPRNDDFPSTREEELDKMDMRLQVAKRLVYPSLRGIFIEALRRRHRPMDELFLPPTE